MIVEYGIKTKHSDSTNYEGPIKVYSSTNLMGFTGLQLCSGQNFSQRKGKSVWFLLLSFLLSGRVDSLGSVNQARYILPRTSQAVLQILQDEFSFNIHVTQWFSVEVMQSWAGTSCLTSIWILVILMAWAAVSRAWSALVWTSVKYRKMNFYSHSFDIICFSKGARDDNKEIRVPRYAWSKTLHTKQIFISRAIKFLS